MNLNPAALRAIHELEIRCPALAGVIDPVTKAVEAICASHRAGGKLLLCGNGGSASDAEHIAGELVKSFVLRRKLDPHDRLALQKSGSPDWHEIADKLQRGVAAISLTGHPALATAVANDTDAVMVFAQQVYVFGRKGDVLLGLSTSGNSRNVLRAFEVARAFGLTTIGMTGGKPCKMDALCDILIKAPAVETFRIQEFHLPIYHTLCLATESELFPDQE